MKRFILPFVFLLLLCFSANAQNTGIAVLGGNTSNLEIILPLGDSITSTVAPYYSSVFGASNKLFVGPLLNAINHAGYPGYTSSQVNGTLSAVLNYMSGILVGNKVVLFHIGTNDCISNVATATIIANMQTTVSSIQTMFPSAHIYIAQILPNGNSTYEARIETLNTSINSTFSGLSNIYVVNIWQAFKNDTNWLTDYMQGDQEHPNAAGATLFAQTFQTAMTANGD